MINFILYEAAINRADIEDSENIKVINKSQLLSTIQSFDEVLLSNEEVRTLFNNVLESMASKNRYGRNDGK